MEQAVLWAAALLTGLLCCRGRGKAVKLALRTAAGGAVLAALEPLEGLLGFSLGVNLFHALVLGALGAPGLGLLLMLRWSMLAL